MSNIGSTISTTVLHFNNAPVSFEITVKNLSNNYASFKINLTAAGADPNLEDNWYSLEPITSTLIPSGDTTKFSVTILNAPILGMDLINLEVRVSSVELPDINFHNLKLHISSGVEQLQVYLPVDSFAIYPRKILDIPVRVSNPNHDRTDVVLRLSGLDARWLERGSERRLKIGAGKEGEITFTCQPPIVKETPCGIYPFTIKAYVGDEEWGKARGKIEIRPIGTVFLTVTPDRHVLPSRAAWLPQFKLEPATYLLELKNASNVTQSNITIAVEDSQCDCQVIPASGEAKPGKTLNLNLEATKKRHWWGLKHKYPLKIVPSLSDRRLNTTDPSSQNVELWVHPLLPLWLQLGLGAIATVLVLWLLSLLSVAGHTDRVNSVTFNNSINPILSGSEDGTVRKWKATPDHLFCKGLNWQRFCLHHQDVLLDSPDAINVVKLRSDDNKSGDFAFVGFDSGTAIKFNLQQTSNKKEIIDNKDSSNRIFDITLSPDLETIYLGRGTGLLPCKLEQDCGRDLIQRNRSIHILTLTPDHKSLLAGGQANEIFMVELDGKNTLKNFNNLHPPRDRDSDKITGLKFTQNNILISSDNQGLLQFWDFDKCDRGKCEPLYTNEGEIDSGINAISLIQYESNIYYLATADTEGKIKLWSFKDNKDVDSVDLKLEKTIEYPEQITSIDLIHQKNDSHNRLLILSGSKDRQVRLNIYNITQ